MYQIKMPQAGQTMEDGTIVRWLKAEGQAVQQGELLLEIETDKATIEVESPHSGVLRKILYPQGETVKVHTPIALVGGADEPIPTAAAAPAPAPAGQAQPAPAQPAPLPPRPAGPPPAGAGGAVVPILMPKAGQSMEEGTILSWRVKPGDRIKVGDVIFEVETDKAAIEVEATDAGRLARVVANEGDVVPVLQPVGYLAEGDADVEAYLAASGAPAAATVEAIAPAGPQVVAVGAAAPAPAALVAAAPAGPVAPGRPKASPAARKIARERGVDLAAIGPGKGPGGRILSTDVPAAVAAPAPMPARAGEAVRRRMSPMRKAIARNLLASKQNIPHFYMRLTIDADPLMSFYRAEKAKYPCSVNDVIVVACARVIAEFPAFRSRLDKDETIELPAANVGIAVGLDDGLVVPVLLGAEGMTLRQVAAESKRLAEAARRGKIEGMGQGVFTVTNLGMFGVEEFSAIINPPEAAILAVGAVREQVIASGGTIRPGKVLTLTLSADHRIVDGLLAAKFLARLREILERPAQLA